MSAPTHQPATTLAGAMLCAQSMWSRTHRNGIDCKQCGSLIEEFRRIDGEQVCQVCSQEEE